MTEDFKPFISNHQSQGIPGLDSVELAGDPVTYRGLWWQPYYGIGDLVQFYPLGRNWFSPDKDDLRSKQ